MDPELKNLTSLWSTQIGNRVISWFENPEGVIIRILSTQTTGKAIRITKYYPDEWGRDFVRFFAFLLGFGSGILFTMLV